MEYLSIQDYSNKWNISKRRIQILCKDGRIKGAKIIGNMWVIPENMERPVDARTKNPIVESNQNKLNVRKELKKLLKNLYEHCTKKNIPINRQKDYILTIIAGELCSYYLDYSISDADINKIYRDITDCNENIEFDISGTEEVSKFIEKYKSDIELDNILSWAYQYSNKYLKDNSFSQTQFFTEKYMISYLIKNIAILTRANKILDPCVGGGNFLAECLEELCKSKTISKEDVLKNCNLLYGYDIDNKITRIAVINIRLRAFSIFKRNSIKFDLHTWNEITPHIFMSLDREEIQGSLTKEKRKVVNVLGKDKILASKLFSNADIVLTNPPFASVKGMKQEQKEFLKMYYPNSKCDTCVAFMEAIGEMLSVDGVCGIVSQSAWMHLKSFENIRNWITEQYSLDRIINLGSGAFQDLSGEKSNVALIIFSLKKKNIKRIKVLNIKGEKYDEKVKSLESKLDYIEKKQSLINTNNGFDFSENDLFEELNGFTNSYKDMAVPMQGTSTGNAKELVGYFWEHFGDKEWTSVSNGGGYCRWIGLNDSVVKWGEDGEYIKQQKGSALRNVKHFQETQIVFSDTGTAGLNVRVLHDNQIFIASGPGIRVKRGNEYAHMALLNSRLASYCIRFMCPKLTIAAGYIGKIPVSEEITSSVILAKDAKLCIELKNKMLSIRANNLEYSDDYIKGLPRDLNTAAWYLFNEDLTNELIKLEIESKIDDWLNEHYGISDDAKVALDENVGKCAYQIVGACEIDLIKLDKYLDKMIDSNCCIKRTKNAKNALGSDGYIEYLAKDLNINPEVVVSKIQEDPYRLERVIKRYKDLILHNFTLYCMGYNIRFGAKVKKMKTDEILSIFINHFNDFDYKNWLKNSFNRIHSEIFKGMPYLIYDKGALYIYD